MRCLTWLLETETWWTETWWVRLTFDTGKDKNLKSRCPLELTRVYVSRFCVIVLFRLCDCVVLIIFCFYEALFLLGVINKLLSLKLDAVIYWSCVLKCLPNLLVHWISIKGSHPTILLVVIWWCILMNNRSSNGEKID